MALERGRFGLLLTLLVLGAGLLLLSVPSAVETPPPHSRLNARKPPYLYLSGTLEGELRGNEPSSFRLRLKQGEALSVALPSARGDLTVRLLAPSGRELARFNSANGLRDTEYLYAFVKVTGDHVLEIRSRAESGRIVRYRLKIGPPHAASERDQLQAAGMSLLSQGERLFDGDDKEARNRAASYYYQALHFWEKTGDLERASATRFRLGWALQRDYQWRPAEQVLRRALTEISAGRSPIAEARLLDRLGRSRFALGENEDAEDLFQQSLDLFRQQQYRPGEADLLGNLGVVARRRGDVQTAIKLDHEALEIWESLGGLKEQATLLNNLGELFLLYGPPDQALRAFEQSFELSIKAGAREEQAVALRGQGTVYGQFGQVDRALALLKRSIEIWRDLGDRHTEVISWVRLGDIFTAANRLAGARDIYEHALRVAEESQDPLGQAMAMGDLGHVLDLQGFEHEGLVYFAKAWSTFEVLDPSTLARIALGQAQALRDLGELEKARLTVKEAIRGFEAYQGPYQRVVAAADRRASYELYVDILMRLRDKTKREEYEVEAFEAAEAARFRTLLDDVGESFKSTRASDPALVKQKAELETRLNAIELRRWALALPKASREFQQIDREGDDLQIRLAVVRRELQARPEHPHPKPLSLREVQKTLEPDSLLLVYFLGKDYSLLWEIGRDRFRSHSLPGRSEIEAKANQVKTALSEPLSPHQWRNWALPLKSLSRLVLSPVAGHLTENKLIIDPDGALNLVPFAALLDPGTLENKGVPGIGPEGPRFLVLDHEIVIVPSISLIAARREVFVRRPPAPGAVAVLADPVFDTRDSRVPVRLRGKGYRSNMPRLAETSQEADAILAEVPPSQSFDARGFQANRATATNPELGRYRILHFATHGWLRDRPDLSGIVLSLIDESGRRQDGFLRAFEIYDLALSSDLVVLSACETGLKSEEGGLVRGFLNAGARQVLATLWPVKDRWTARLMASFYRAHLRQGLSTSAALREAQRELLESSHGSSPYYWAGFVLNGDWN